MLTVTIEIKDEQGTVLITHRASATHPTQVKTDPEKPLEDEDYKLFGFTFQPHVMLKRKSGGC